MEFVPQSGGHCLIVALCILDASGRDRKAQVSLPSGQGWFSCPRAKRHSMPHLHMATFSLPKTGWPHSACPLGALLGLCCPLNRAQPLSGNMLAVRSQNCAREQAYNGTARAGACLHASTCSGPLCVPGTNRTVFILILPKFSSIFKSCSQAFCQPYCQDYTILLIFKNFI